MINFTTGDLLKSTAYALVNTVNCEGYMGKGLAYQFKVKYPEMNKDYIKACRSHELVPGKLHCYKTEDRLIINFPTKNKWIEKSEIDYITSGLDELVKVIQAHNIKSIAIPPLGCGNGGLIWNEVKEAILQRLNCISDTVDVFVYEPSKNYATDGKTEPQLSLSALVLMNIKFRLNTDKFGKICLQKTAYFMNVLSDTEYFHFKKGIYGPYDHSIDLISKGIKEFQKYHKVENTEEAYEILLKELISKTIQDKLDFYIPYIEKAAEFTNKLPSVQDVEGAGTALFIVQQNKVIDSNGIVQEFKNWSEDKAARFSEESIYKAIDSLEANGFIKNTLCGYELNKNYA